MSLKDDIKDVPSWVWLGGAAAAGVLLFLHARTAASSAGSVPLTSGSGQVGAVQSGLASDGTLPSQYNPPPATTPTTPTPPATISGIPFSQWLQSGEGSTGAINQQQIQDYLSTGQQYASQISDPAFNDWLSQGYQFTNSGPRAGDQAGVQAWKQAGYGFLGGAIAAGDPLAQPVGIAGQILPAPVTRTLTPPAGGGGGGFSYHPAATQTGGMSDAFGLQSPTNPSIHG